MTFSVVLGSNLRRLRIEAEMTQTAVAEKAGVTRAHYSALEAGASSNGGPANPRLATLLSLSGALGVSLIELLDGVA